MDANDIELLSELSPLQQAMLFHSLYAPSSGVYVMRESMRLSGPLDVLAFVRAWRHLVARHEVLRTSFYWEEMEKPLQVVYREVEVPFLRESWLGCDAGEQHRRLERYLAEDLARGFDLASPPLLRLALFELEPSVHQFVWTQHHILIDGWSRGLLLKELFTCYRAFVDGREPDLGQAGSYHQYIEWLQGQDPLQSEAYWRRSLAGFSAPTSPVAGEGRRAAPTDFRSSGQQDLRLSEAVTADLRAQARRHRLTLNTLVQGAWALLLARTLGVDDVVFGTTLAGRPADLPGVESTVGLFINTLPLRVEVTPERRLLPWLAELQQRNVELRRHEHSPLVDVQRWSELPSGSALFDHLLAFENVPLDREISRLVPDLAVSDLLANSLTNYPLNLIVFPGAELWLEILHDRDRISPTETARLLARWAGLLTSFTSNVDLPLWQVPLLLPAERQQVEVEWNDTASEYPRERSLHELFAAWAESRPEATAIVGEAEEWSYRRLDEASNRLAWHLRSLGVGPESRVGISMERSADLIVGVLGILKAGGAYVPLDAGYPDERLAFMIEDTGASVVVVHGRTRERLASLVLPEDAARPRLVSLEEDREAIASRSAAAPPSAISGVSAEHLAYVIYTSGSTGRPKGVAVAHRAIVRLVLGTNYVQLGTEDRLGNVSNISFDAATFEIWGALLNGGTLVVIDREVVLSPADFIARLRAERVTAMFLTAALFNQTVREIPGGFASVRNLLVGGEALDPVSVGRALAAGRPGRLLNGYGPTESTTFAVWHEARELSPDETNVPIGLPLANTTAHILDRWQGPAALGQVGELCLGGEGLARGYLNRPELTAERFVPSPSNREAGGRLYRTGDLARRRSDGAIEYLGRLDHQVKIRGFRIEPGEIEAVLAGCPGVRECAVLARRDTPGDVKLVAYVVAGPGEALSAGALWEYLGRSLPEYMLPSVYLFLESLPLTANGKLDRAALPSPEAPERIGKESEGYSAPRNPTEGLLAGIWEEVLGRERVGVEDDFFALGGHSLLATKIVSRVRQAFGVELPLQNLFERPTLAGLAAKLDELLRGEVRAEMPPLLPIPPALRQGDLPLSFAQQRLWFIDQLEPGSPAYNLPFAFHASGPLHIAALAESFAELVRRHEVLRTTFVRGEDGPRQRVGEPGETVLSQIDLSGLSEAPRALAAERLMREEARRPFDLARGPLLRTALLRLAEGMHLLLFNLHHVIADGWSSGVMIREVAALYDAFRQGRPSPLPALPIQYGDFAAWQRQWLSGPVLEREIGFWRDQLAGAPAVIDLPLDRPRPPVQSFRGTSHAFRLPAELAAGVEAFCRRQVVTPFILLVSAFETLLWRYTGAPDSTLGMPIAGRNRLETEGLIGFFVNTLVLRCDLSGNPSFGELLSRLRGVVLAAYAHQDLPFEMLVEALQPQRSLRYEPLFQVAADFHRLERLPEAENGSSGVRFRPVESDQHQVHFDLTLTGEENRGLGGRLEYRTDLFDGTTIRRMLEHLQVLLAAVAQDESTVLSELPLLSAGERQQLHAEQGEQESFPEGCLHQRFAAQALRLPAAPAVVAGVLALSYQDLDRQANRWARRLQELGVGPEEVVGICLERSPEMVVAVLAVLKAGGAYLPLDPAYPQERLAYMLADSRARVVLTEERLAGIVSGTAARAVFLDTMELGHELGDGPVESAVGAQNLAYVIYTSGSTGRPRGVLVTHGNVIRLLAATDSWFGFGEKDVWTLFHSYAFDFSVWEIWGALAYGGALVVVPYWVSRSPESFYELLVQERVTVLNQTPSAFRQLIAAEEAVGASPDLALRLVIFGGEALDLASLAPWVERHGAARPRLVNMYGITETTVHVTYRPISAGEVSGGAPSLIGEPIPDLALRVLGPGLALQPLGIAGELSVAGAGLARGYLGRPELTAEKFVPDPWGTEPGARLYRSGDLGLRRWDGDVQYLGRIDHQVKVRGFRIELGEIEAALSAHPSVRECVVLARQDEPGDTRLVAYLTAKEGERPREADLKEHLRHRLPEHMLPSAYLLLDALPLTTNGKVDRKALPAPEGEVHQAEGYVAPRGPIEEILAAIWQEVLGRESVGARDDFFALGGHSILATQVITRVRRAFQVEIPVRSLFETPTVEALSRAIEAARQGDPEVAAPPLQPVSEREGLPLSFAQERLWFVDQLEPGNPAYNVPWGFEIQGELGVDLLARAFSEVVRRHEVLRTTFSASLSASRGAVQVIAPALPVPLPVVALAGLPEAVQRAEVLRLGVAEAGWRFDLRSGPLLRLLLLRLAEREHVLLVTVHHITSDGWSVGVLLREMGALYEALRRGAPSPLPELAVQYADFAVWQREWLQGEALTAQLAYWREQLAGAPRRLELPTDRPRPARTSHRGKALPVALGEALSRELSALSRREGVTPFMALLAAFGALLGRAAHQEVLLVGTPIANRNRQEIEGLIGFFVNTLVLRVDLAGGPSGRELLARVRQAALGSFSHQDLPFERLVDELDPDRDPRQSPFFQVMLALQNAPVGGLDLPGLHLRAIEIPARTSKFDLTLALGEREGKVGGAIEFSSDLFDTTTIERWIGHLTILLRALVEETDRPVMELPILLPSERQQLFEWGGLRGYEPAGETLAEWFEERVRRAPDGRAVTCAGAELSYGELNRRANRLAWRLRELGVGPEERVGLSIERSLDLVIGVLGIAKAGGAYVPIDPAYPLDRRTFLLADSGARFLVGGEQALADLPAPGTTVLLGSWEEGLERYPETDSLPSGSRENVAYVIYTSGSTGRPKGVLVTHGNVTRLFRATEPWFRFGAEDVWSLFHSYAFDFSVWEIWGALLYGGRLVVVPHAVSRTPEAFHDLLATEGVTVLSQTPSAFSQLMRVDEDPARAGALSDLRLVIFGGEALEPTRLAPWFARHGDRRPRLVNMYGITETTVHVTYRPLGLEDARSGRGSVIGVPIPDLAVSVHEPGFALAPIGIPGELAIGGAGLARGYLGRPELTAERFVPDPVSGEPGARLYRSGDLGRFLPTGELEYLGRIDHQVKIRGFRIEVDEIQVALAEHPEVREAVVLAREEAGGERRLIAYVVPRPGRRPEVSALRERLASRLPEHMVPAVFVLLEALPLTENGKVDRKALLALSMSQRQESTAYQPPANGIEAALAEIFEQVLGLDRVGIDDRFFSLGGDSILSLRVRVLAEERGLHFSLQQLLEHQTIRELACRIEPGPEALAVPTEPFGLLAQRDREALPAGLEDAYPLANLQTGMLFHGDLTADSDVYLNVTSCKLALRFDEAAFRGAISELFARHPVLRTSFDLGGFSEPLQLVHRWDERRDERGAMPLRVEDLRGLPEEEQERRSAAAFAAERRTPFDRSVAPLLRFRIALLREDLVEFTWTEHHAILDGWSVASMLAELVELYRRLEGGDLPPFAPPPAASFRDFVALERRALQAPEVRGYWLKKLADAPRTLLPRRPGTEANGLLAPRMREAAVRATPELAGSIKRLAGSLGVPFKSVLLAAHFRALALATGETDLVTGLVANGRPEVRDGERVLGLFLNTLPLRLELTGGTWLDLIRQAFAADRETGPFRRFPMAELQRLLGGAPLFEAAFNFVHFHVLAGLDGGEMRAGGERVYAETNFPFTASFELAAGGSWVDLSLKYDERLFHPRQMEAMAGRYLRILGAMAADPEARYETASLLSAAERQQLRVEWNDTGGSRPPALTIPDLVSACARRDPAALAVSSPAGQLTYGELETRAHGLALRLRSLGVGPEVPVAVCIGRSLGRVVALLAVLKAGGAFVSLDPEYPKERLAFVVDDAGAPVLLTERPFRGRMPETPAAVLCIDEEEAGDGPPLPSRIQPGNLAYVIYTSGSTGRPKGVGVPHAGLMNLVRWHQDLYGVTSEDRATLLASPAFDASVWELWPYLTAGASLHIPDEEARLSPTEMVRWWAREGITLSFLPTALAEGVLEAPWSLPELRLRALLTGGDRLHRRPHPGTAFRLMNHYGPAESSVVTTVGEVPVAAEAGSFEEPPPIGRPIAGARVDLLDPWGQPVPLGSPGEVYIGGQGLARGYSGRPDLTAERFLPDSGSGEPGARSYRTGDRARRLPDGQLHFLGRLDHQVKIRGFRIELGEIETVLAQHPAVTEAVVLARENPSGDRALAAYVVAAREPRPAAGDLARFLGERLPAYMVPAAFVFLDRLPLTVHGKVDLRVLPAAEPSRELTPDHLGPRDLLELQIVQLWEELLGVRPIGVRDDFFSLGGHSLLAVQLMARIQSRLGASLPIATLLRHPTVERLAAALRQAAGSVPRRALVEIEPGNGQPFFLVHPIGGDVLCYVHLARYLAGGRSLYGLQIPDAPEGTALSTVQGMATHYIRCIQEVQPAGPYSLGGWSMGGVVAFEMARQLAAAGEPVDLLALLDSYAPGGGGGGAETPAGGALVALFATDLARLLHLSSLELPEGFGELAAEEALRWLGAEVERLGLLPAGLGEAELVRRFEMFRANHQALERYAAGTCPAPLTLFKATHSPPGAVRADLGWGRWSELPVEVREIPGDHYTLLREPQVGILASQLRERLAAPAEGKIDYELHRSD